MASPGQSLKMQRENKRTVLINRVFMALQLLTLSRPTKEQQ